MIQANHFLTTLTSLLPQQFLHTLATETEAVQRERQFCLSTFCWTLILGFSTNPRRQLTGFRRTYLSYAPKFIGQSAFNARFNKPMSRFFCQTFEYLLQKVKPECGLYSGLLNNFEDILSIDSTLIQIADVLQKWFKGVSTPAGVKLNLVYSAKRKHLKRFQMGSASESEKSMFKVGDWVANCLVLLDKGYYCMDSLQAIVEKKGSFITPLKQNAAPKVLSVVGWEAFDERLSFQIVQGEFCGEDFDAEVEFKVGQRFRVVGLWNEESSEYHWYLTNLPASQYSPLEIGILYRYRWMIELLFKELKSGHSLDELPRARKEVIEILIYAAFCSWLVSQHLRQSLKKQVNDLRWTQLFSAFCSQFLASLFPVDEMEKRIVRILLKEMPDPNRKRRSLAQQVDQGLFYGAA